MHDEKIFFSETRVPKLCKRPIVDTYIYIFIYDYITIILMLTVTIAIIALSYLAIGLYMEYAGYTGVGGLYR